MYFDQQLCLFHLDVKDQNQLFCKMASKLHEEGFVKSEFLKGIINREKEYPTAILVNATGFAIPHTDSSKVKHSQICFASLKHPIEFCSMTNKDEKISVELVFMLAMSKPHEQVETLQNLVELFQNDKAIEKLKKCNSKEEFTAILNHEKIY